MVRATTLRPPTSPRRSPRFGWQVARSEFDCLEWEFGDALASRSAARCSPRTWGRTRCRSTATLPLVGGVVGRGDRGRGHRGRGAAAPRSDRGRPAHAEELHLLQPGRAQAHHRGPRGGSAGGRGCRDRHRSLHGGRPVTVSALRGRRLRHPQRLPARHGGRAAARARRGASIGPHRLQARPRDRRARHRDASRAPCPAASSSRRTSTAARARPARSTTRPGSRRCSGSRSLLGGDRARGTDRPSNSCRSTARTTTPTRASSSGRPRTKAASATSCSASTSTTQASSTPRTTSRSTAARRAIEAAVREAMAGHDRLSRGTAVGAGGPCDPRHSRGAGDRGRVQRDVPVHGAVRTHRARHARPGGLRHSSPMRPCFIRKVIEGVSRRQS